MSGCRPTLRELELSDLRNLSISDENELYWKGERIEVRNRLRLTRTQAIGAFLVGTAAVFGGVAKGLNDGLPPELAAVSASAPANLAAGLKVDTGFWHDNLPKLRQRFDAWQGH